MKVCVIGQGGREHALVWRLAQSESVTQVYAAPGSEAMQDVAKVTGLAWEDTAALLAFLRVEAIDLVVIGPEAPLVAGLSDVLRQEGFAVFGPSQGAAQLEGSKAFAKHIMAKYQIPTAAYREFTDLSEAKAYIESQPLPLVIKADGLAAGKGVVVAMTREEALSAAEMMLGDGKFGRAGQRVVIEAYLDGEEASLLAFVDGKTVVPMVAAQDHKRIFDGDKGPNTGGMGAYAPAKVVTSALRAQVVKEILEPMVEAMAAEGIPYQGCLYAGLMITAEGPKVVEFNARFGDPETQVVLPLLDGDLGEILMACATGNLREEMVRWRSKSAATVIMASKGYPETSHKGDAIKGDLGETENTVVFHSGTHFNGKDYETAGGRVLAVTAWEDTLGEALQTAYERVATISFDGMQYRKDIGHKGL